MVSLDHHLMNKFFYYKFCTSYFTKGSDIEMTAKKFIMSLRQQYTTIYFYYAKLSIATVTYLKYTAIPKLLFALHCPADKSKKSLKKYV